MLTTETVILLVISFILFVLVLKKTKENRQLTLKCERYSTLLDSINLPIFYNDKDGKLIGCNKSFEISFGDYKKQTIDQLKEFKTTCEQEYELTYDNNIKKHTIVNFTNYLDGSIGIIIDKSTDNINKEALQKRNEKLELIMKGSQDGYWEWDTKINTIKFSKRALEILGYEENEKPPESIMDWMNLVESYDIAKTNEALSLHTRGEIDFIDIDHRLKTSLKELWVNFRGKGVYNSSNEITKVYGTLRDISEQKIELKRVTKQKNLFTTFMDNLPVLGFIKDQQGKYIYINSAYQKLLGFKRWENKTAEEIFGKEISEKINESDREAFYEGKNKHLEYILNEEGKTQLFETYKFPVDSEHEKVLCGFGIDITQEKIYQSKTELYAKIFDNTQEAIILTDEEGIVIAVNSAFKDITGFTDKDMIGENPNIRQSGKHNKEFYVDMWKTLLTKGAWSGEMFNKHKNGVIYPELMNINSIKNKKGKVTNFVGIFQSIERQKLFESKLRKMAHYDTLTNLPNRLLFDDRLEKAMQRANRDKNLLSLIFVDLDDFKTINDTFGHNSGDIVLTEVSKRLIHTVRDSDTVARIGGDEFVIIVEKINNISDVSAIAQKIISDMSLPIKLKGSKECVIGVSLGISTYPTQTINKKELLEFADHAMYEAKQSGKNCYKIYSN